MDFLKKHYEKILLGVMLAGLIGVLVFMLFYISGDALDMNNKRQNLINPPVRQLTNLDLTALEAVTARAQVMYRLDLENSNKLFNPLAWQKTPDNNLILQGTRTGPQVVVVTNIAPLYTVVWLDSVITNELGVRYVIKVEKQAAASPGKRHAVSFYVSKDEKSKPDFTLLEVKGLPESPDELVLKLTDTGEVIRISKDHVFRRVDGHLADFRYDPENKAFHAKRNNDKISFGGSSYTVVDVSEHEVVLQDETNQKKTSLPFNP